MRTRTRIVAGAAVAAVLGASAVAYALSQGTHSTQTTTCDYAQSFTTVATLAAHSDLVVAGQVTKRRGSTSGDGGPATDFTFSVATALSDPGRRLPPGAATVTVHQTGDSAGTQCQEDPLFATGSQSVLFLHEYAPGSYSVVGGPNGRLILQDGRVSPFSAQSLQFTGTVADLARQISAGH